jgi:hypothetical protein
MDPPVSGDSLSSLSFTYHFSKWKHSVLTQWGDVRIRVLKLSDVQYISLSRSKLAVVEFSARQFFLGSLGDQSHFDFWRVQVVKLQILILISIPNRCEYWYTKVFDNWTWKSIACNYTDMVHVFATCLVPSRVLMALIVIVSDDVVCDLEIQRQLELHATSSSLQVQVIACWEDWIARIFDIIRTRNLFCKVSFRRHLGQY